MTASINAEVLLTLDDAVAEVLGQLTGLDLQYQAEQDRYYAITRALNRALRANALEVEWSYYASTESLGVVAEGVRSIFISTTMRPRIISDDAIRLMDDTTGETRLWAYFLPRDAIHKYDRRSGLWASVLRNEIVFSRPFRSSEVGLTIYIPVMREPTMFQLPEQPEDPNDPIVEVDTAIREQPVDFSYPDLIIARASYFYAQTDPVMQPRVPTLENDYKDLMYQLKERDEGNTDSPYLNDFFVPVQNSLDGPSFIHHAHPHSDERRL